MSGKRGLEDEEEDGELPSEEELPNRKKVVRDMVAKVHLDEMDEKMLREEHRKLIQEFQEHEKHKEFLQKRILTLEQWQKDDDLQLNVINRYWNQLNENVRLLLERFDATTAKNWKEDEDEFSKGFSFLSQLATWDLEELDEKLETRHRVSAGAVAKIVQAFDCLQQRQEEMIAALRGGDEVILTKALEKNKRILENENREMTEFNRRLEEKYADLEGKVKEGQIQLLEKVEKTKELKAKEDDLKWEVEQLVDGIHKIQKHLEELKEKCKKEEMTLPVEENGEGSKLGGLREENKELRKVAGERLKELEVVHEKHTAALNELEGLKMDMKMLPESLIVETEHFRNLQSVYSVIYNENLNLEGILKHLRSNIGLVKEQQQKKWEELEERQEKEQIEEQTKLLEVQKTIHQVKRDYEQLKLDIEQNKVAIEEAKPVDEEMRYLIASMEGRKEQLIVEGNRYRKKYAEACKEHARVKKQVDELKKRIEGIGKPKVNKAEDEKVKKETRSQLKKALNDQRELGLLLDMYTKQASKEQEEKVKLMASEVKLRQEAEEIKKQIRALQKEDKTKEMAKKKMSREEAEKRIKALELQKSQLEKQVGCHKQEEDTLVAEMDSTAQAFDEIQEENLKLLQQLREKDSANFKLVSDKVKDEMVRRYDKEEVEVTKGKLETCGKQIEERKGLGKSLEENNKILEETLEKAKKEGELREQAMKLNKKKAEEDLQLIVERKQKLEGLEHEFKKVKQVIGSNAGTLFEEHWKQNRLQEEITQLRRKYEELKHLEVQSCKGEVLQEEIKEYKEALTCAACRINRKDAVLTKCFHVFCFECLRSRYETRKRKCPKCNMGFGPNDYHRLYLS